MIDFLRPEAFLLAPLALLVLRRRLLHPSRAVVALRALLLLVLAALVAGPGLPRGDEGRDVVLVVDRSRSMPADASATAVEWSGLLQGARRPADRIRHVVFAERPVVAADGAEGGAGAPLDGDGSDLAGALRTALALVPPERPASILVVSDGEATGADPVAAARAALRRGVRIDAVPVRRRGPVDAAVASLGLPGEVAAGEPFRFAAWIRSDRAGPAVVRLTRDGEVLAEGVRDLEYGTTRILLRDRLERAGVARYALEVEVPGDRVPENDVARAFVRAVAPRRVLCVTPRGREDRLTRSLRNAGVELDVVAPTRLPWRPPGLDAYAAVVLENVPAGVVTRPGLNAVASFVRDQGGGLLLTGGRASFGIGGYHASPLDPVLPVSLELKKELRKFAVAIVLVLDRSGSMGRAVGSGETKMKLANLGAVAAIDLLSPMDAVSVVAVDSSAHLVVPLRPAEDLAAARDRVRRIEARGGGIFVAEALAAARAQLENAEYGRRHVVLFADAADAEQPGAYEQAVPALRRDGVTVSVIGLGRETDADAGLLKRIAELGGGRAVFVDDARDLPRVFAQETIEVSRAGFLAEPVRVLARPGLQSLGDFGRFEPPPLGGSNAARLRPRARLALQSWDEEALPLLAYWNVGLGRCAAFLGEVDGPHTGAWREWEPAGDLFATVVRWLMATTVSGPLFATASREGHEAVVEVEVERGAEARLADVRALRLREGGPEELVLRRTGARRMEARVPLSGDAVFRAVVHDGAGRVRRLPPVRLPYSPEFEPRAPGAEGGRLLARLARLTGGTVDPAPEAVWAGPRGGGERLPLGDACALFALGLLLAEIAARRFPRRALARGIPAPPRRKRRRGPASAPPKTSPSRPPAPADDLDSVLGRAKSRARRRR